MGKTAGSVDCLRLGDRALKRSSKLLACQIEMIGYWRERGLSYQKIATMFHVSKRLIIFICRPELREKNLEMRDNKKYYDKDKQRDFMRKHRQMKTKLTEKYGKQIITATPKSIADA